MQTLRCKCGDKVAWTSMGMADCQGCDICGTTFAGHPDNHKPLQPHEWFITFSQKTGKPYKRCKKCHTADAESYREAEQ